MTILRGLILALIALPLMEIAIFIAVGAAIGFGWALGLIVALSFLGAITLRHAGGANIDRVRAAVGNNRLSMLHANAAGALTLIAGLLLLVPGFITGFFGLMLLIPALRRMLGNALGLAAGHAGAANDNIVDLTPDDWQRIPNDKIPDHRQRHDP